MLKFFQGLWDSITGIFKSETIQTLATVGVSVGLMKYPELREPTIIATQKVIERIDTNTFLNIEVAEKILISEFAKANISGDQRLAGIAAITLYKPMLDKHLDKIDSVRPRLKIQEIRALAVTVNNAAGGTAK